MALSCVSSVFFCNTLPRLSVPLCSRVLSFFMSARYYVSQCPCLPPSVFNLLPVSRFPIISFLFFLRFSVSTNTFPNLTLILIFLEPISYLFPLPCSCNSLFNHKKASEAIASNLYPIEFSSLRQQKVNSTFSVMSILTDPN